MKNTEVKFIYLEYLLKVFSPFMTYPMKTSVSKPIYKAKSIRDAQIYFPYVNPVFIFTVRGMRIINTDFSSHYLRHYPLKSLTYECLPAVTLPLKRYKNSLRFHSSNF